MIDIDEVLRNNLNAKQYLAAVDDASEVLTLACAGSGKSRTLAYRIARLIAKGHDPHGIVAFTFTEKAAESIRHRVSEALAAAGLPPTKLGAMYIGTIHSYCYNILCEMDARYRQFDVLDDNRLALYLISRLSRLDLYRFGKSRFGPGRVYFRTIREVRDAWKTVHDEMLDLGEIRIYDEELGDLLLTLNRLLDQDEYIDFSLMIRRAVDALADCDAQALSAIADLEHLMVDEYQDVNPAQEALIRELHRQSSTLFVVGDDDQSIYAWRGADVSNILTFGKRYSNCGTHTISLNYRSTPAIVAAADEFARKELGAMRIVKNPQSAAKGKGPTDFRKVWFKARDDEADWVVHRIKALKGTRYVERDGTARGLTWGDFAVLMRSTKQPEQDGTARHEAFTARLDEASIPYSLEAGGSVFARPQVAVLRDSFELLRSESPDRDRARGFFEQSVMDAYPKADFDRFARVLADWGRRIHAPITGQRRRVYPQELVYDLLNAFGIIESDFDEATMFDIGVFSKMMLDVETVYVSIDSTRRFQSILNFLTNIADSGYDSSTNDLLARPDAIFVSTVHKAKGLEFPVVFVVDVQPLRFPKRRSSYRGLLPQQVIVSALNRGAYQSTREEESRLFYTAITRAERYLYVTGCVMLPGGKRPSKPSPFWHGLSASSTSPSGLPAGLVSCPAARRIDETVLPTTFSDLRYYLRCPRDYLYRVRFGFRPPVPELFGFGRTVHTAISRLHQGSPDRAPTPGEVTDLVGRTFHLKHVPPSNDPLNKPGPYERAKAAALDMVANYVSEYGDDFRHRRQVEARFEMPVEQALISGSIDLILTVDDDDNIVGATIVDFKTMEGGEQPESNEMLDWAESSLQVQLYAKAATDVLGENARTGSVHLLKDNQRVEVPVSDEALEDAVEIVEWAVNGIVKGDFPARPSLKKCASCDFGSVCGKKREEFGKSLVPPPVHVPGSPKRRSVRAIGDVRS